MKKYTKDQVERLSILGASIEQGGGVTKLDLSGVKMRDIKKVFRILECETENSYIMQGEYEKACLANQFSKN